MKVKYVGPDDVRILDQADLAKKGVEDFSYTRFGRREIVEVSDDVALILISEPDLFGEFELIEEKVKVVTPQTSPSVPSTTKETKASKNKPALDDDELSGEDEV